MHLLDPGQEARAGHVGHALVAEDHLHVVQGQHVEPLEGRRRRQDAVPVVAEQHLEREEHVWIVVDQQQRGP